MNEQLEKIKKAVEPLRQQIVNHKVYSMINDLDDLKIFMHYHIFLYPYPLLQSQELSFHQSL